MSLTPLPTLDDLARDPARARDLPPEAARDLLAQLAPLQALLLAQAFRSSASANGQPDREDRLLTVKEAAQRLGVSADTIYRRKPWPFEVRPSGRSRRFSSQGIDRYIRQRQGR